MLTLHFEGRDVPPYAEYAPADTLVEGKTYFRLGYLDKDLTIPKMNPMIFIGRDLGQGDASQLYFQDAESYLDGTRFGTATRNGDAEFHVVDETRRSCSNSNEHWTVFFTCPRLAPRPEKYQLGTLKRR